MINLRTWWAILFMSIGLLYSCAGQPKYSKIDETQGDFNASGVSREKYSDADAVYILKETKLEAYPRYIVGTLSFDGYEEIHVIKKIFKNFNKHSNIKIHVDEMEEVVELSARTISPDGTVSEVEKDHFIEKASSDDSFASRIIEFTFPSVEPDAVVEYVCKKKVLCSTIKVENRGWVFPIPICGIWEIQDNLPIVKNRFSVTVPERVAREIGFPWRFKTYNYPQLTEPEPRSLPLKLGSLTDLVCFSWELKDIEAVKNEEFMPPPQLCRAYMAFGASEIRTWDDLSEWYYDKVFEPNLLITQKIKQTANRLALNAKDDLERIKACYQFVQDIRYCAIDIDVRRITPRRPEEILEKRYGDCKDKAMLLVALLNSLEIKAEPVLVLTRNHGCMDPIFPSFNFDHMIAKATLKDGKGIWLDATSQYHPAGAIHWIEQGVWALVLHEDGTSTREILPETDESENLISFSIDIDLKLSGESVFHIIAEMKGEQAAEIKYDLGNKSEREIMDYCKGIVANNFLNAKIDNVSHSSLSSSDNVFLLKFDVIVSNVVQKQGGIYFVQLDPLSTEMDIAWLGKESRIYPIDFPYPKTFTKTIRLNYPNDRLEILGAPENSDLVGKSIDYSVSVNSNTHHEITISKTLRYKKCYIKKEGYQDLRSIFCQIQKKDREQLVFKMTI